MISISHSRLRKAFGLLALLMAVTINTIPAQTGELARMLVTVGAGGANTSNRTWYQSGSTGSVSDDSDVAISGDLIINRILWHTSDDLRFFRSGAGSFADAVTATGVLAGKSFLLAVNDAGDAIDAQFDIDTADFTTRATRISLRTTAAQQALFNAVATGDLINIVISDVPSDVVEVFVDTAAEITAAAPTITASADKELPAAVFDTAAVVTAGAPALTAIAEKVHVFVRAAEFTAGVPTLAASAEKVGLAQEFHDTEAAVTAGAPVVAAVAEFVEGGIHEVLAPFVAGAPLVDADAETVGLAQAFHDTAAALESGPADLAAAAELVGLAQEFHDTDAFIESGAATLDVLAEHDEAGVIEVLASFVAGAALVDVDAEKVDLAQAFHDTAARLDAGAPEIAASLRFIGVQDTAASFETGAGGITAAADKGSFLGTIPQLSGLAGIVRQAIATANMVTGDLQVIVRHGVIKSRSSSGRIEYASITERQAIVEPITKVFRDNDGVERVSKARITILSDVAVSMNDLLILPSGQTGPILQVSGGLADPGGGNFLTQVWLG